MRIQLASAVALTLAFGAAATAPSAQAETLQFTYGDAGRGGIDFSFDQSATPTPLAYDLGADTQVSVTNWIGNIGPYSSIVWFNADTDGQFDTPDGDYIVFGPQIYSGSESAPVFSPGVYSAADQTTGFDGTLVISLVPEPAAWAVMILGMGLLGATLRRRRAAPAA